MMYFSARQFLEAEVFLDQRVSVRVLSHFPPKLYQDALSLTAFESSTETSEVLKIALRYHLASTPPLLSSSVNLFFLFADSKLK